MNISIYLQISHLTRTVVGLAIAGTFVLASPARAQTTVFSDDFNNPNGTPINGKSPLVGSPYNVVTGAGTDVNQSGAVSGTGLSVAPDSKNGNNLSYISDGAARVVYGNFNTSLGTLSAATPLLTVAIDGNFFRNGTGTNTLAGLSLYTGGAATNPGGAAERVFIGDRYGVNSNWGMEFTGGAGADATNFTGQQVGTVTYNFNTGVLNLYSGATATGTPLISLTGSTGLAIDSIRFLNQNGGDLSFNNLSFTIGAVVPEPSTVLLPLGISALTALGLRRRFCC